MTNLFSDTEDSLKNLTDEKANLERTLNIFGKQDDTINH